MPEGFVFLLITFPLFVPRDFNAILQIKEVPSVFSFYIGYKESL